MSQSLNDEPTKTQLVLGNVAAGGAVLGVLALAALSLPFFLVGFVCNLPKALENYDATRRHHKNRQDFP